jgi:hypothetical protein
MVNSVNATVRLLAVVIVVFEILLRLLIDTDVYFQIPHFLIYLLLIKTQSLNVDLAFTRVILLVWTHLLLFLTIPFEFLDCFFNLNIVDHLEIND